VLEGESRGKLSIDPIGKAIGGKMVAVPTGCENDPQYKKFADTYLQPGQTYSVLFGGAPAGIIDIKGGDSDMGSTLVEYDGVAKVHGRLMAIATNAPHPILETSPRKAASAEERDWTLKFADQTLAAKGLPSDIRKNVQIENLTHTIIAPRSSPVLIGSLALPSNDDSGIVHALFFIASENAGELTPEFQWVHISEGEAAVQVLNLVDQADLFGDGREELIAVLGYYKNYQYQLYSRANSGSSWEKIFETEVLGCL
jgi:hypothetical protein